MRSSSPVLCYPFPTVPFHLCFQYFNISISCFQYFNISISAFSIPCPSCTIPPYSPCCRQGSGVQSLSTAQLWHHRAEECGDEQWGWDQGCHKLPGEAREWLLGAQECGPLRRHPQHRRQLPFPQCLGPQRSPWVPLPSPSDSQQCPVVLPALR